MYSKYVLKMAHEYRVLQLPASSDAYVLFVLFFFSLFFFVSFYSANQILHLEARPWLCELQYRMSPLGPAIPLAERYSPGASRSGTFAIRACKSCTAPAAASTLPTTPRNNRRDLRAVRANKKNVGNLAFFRVTSFLFIFIFFTFFFFVIFDTTRSHFAAACVSLLGRKFLRVCTRGALYIYGTRGSRQLLPCTTVSPLRENHVYYVEL